MPFAVMWHTPPRGGTTGFTPPKKKQAKRDEDLNDAVEKMEGVSKKLFKEAAEEEGERRDERGGGPEGSPGSTLSAMSTSSVKSSLAEELSNIANKV